ncbi:hypothetical protein BV22DRAFT_1049252 [Leucogyrophana mollusca]|uniref:Uncharacterized protein n=1 Tax=Leucogyrophana mollusca TaxID=85980 RepID=A0ACB8B8C9_9AGAM|nr:hypothetical protein BV22DRAFT_1049252 [Leucogyrophana mollusca]
MSWTPDETPAQLAIETAWIQGYVLSGVGYGVALVLFAICTHTLWTRIRHRRTRSDTYLFVYVLIAFGLGTATFATNAKFIQLAFVNNRNFPGGPGAYTVAMFSVPVNIASSATYVLASCYGAVRSCTRIAECSLGLLQWAFQAYYFSALSSSSPPSSPYQDTVMGFNFTLPFFSAALAFNIVIALMIVARLLYCRRCLSRISGPGSNVNVALYTSLTAIIVESASLYSVGYLLFIIPFAMNNAFVNAPMQFLAEMETIASLLIIYRVMQGKAWSRDAVADDNIYVPPQRVRTTPSGVLNLHPGLRRLDVQVVKPVEVLVVPVTENADFASCSALSLALYTFAGPLHAQTHHAIEDTT